MAALAREDAVTTAHGRDHGSAPPLAQLPDAAVGALVMGRVGSDEATRCRQPNGRRHGLGSSEIAALARPKIHIRARPPMAPRYPEEAFLLLRNALASDLNGGGSRGRGMLEPDERLRCQ